MADAPGSPDGLEAMAFQLLLHKVTNLEHAVQSLPPLLKKIIDHLEAQAKQPEVPIATYEQLYAKYLEAPEEDADAEATAAPVIEVTAAPPPKGQHRRRVWWWFVKETS